MNMTLHLEIFMEREMEEDSMPITSLSYWQWEGFNTQTNTFCWWLWAVEKYDHSCQLGWHVLIMMYGFVYNYSKNRQRQIGRQFNRQADRFKGKHIHHKYRYVCTHTCCTKVCACEIGKPSTETHNNLGDMLLIIRCT